MVFDYLHVLLHYSPSPLNFRLFVGADNASPKPYVCCRTCWGEPVSAEVVAPVVMLTAETEQPLTSVAQHWLVV